ncbi:hypothetical protein [Maribacter sp. ACAM166]|uniref:hypothetical protein n=1 Tax=Maribacter sp. ACAM166 TaxID=2508996 RepID=UPI0010FE6973|nr:hypothetical protein [Maribacter sp. ACAM166]TLP79211.1 hypothetical protein ES765_11550 [Maribacter sp. ACAM166]
MKKIFFYISAILSLILIVNIIQIVTTDFERLTEYGFGYLIGKIILFGIFLSLTLLTKKHIREKEVTE